MTNKPEKHSTPREAAFRSRRDPQKASRIKRTMKLAAAIEDAMIAKGWNRSQFAAAMNVQPSQITRWLSGTQGINSDSIFDMEYVLGTKFMLQDPVSTIHAGHYHMDFGSVTVPVHHVIAYDFGVPLLGVIMGQNYPSGFCFNRINQSDWHIATGPIIPVGSGQAAWNSPNCKTAREVCSSKYWVSINGESAGEQTVQQGNTVKFTPHLTSNHGN